MVFLRSIKKINYIIAVLALMFSRHNRPVELIKIKLRELRFVNLILRRISGKSFPSTLLFHLTFRCNLKCRGCDLHGENGCVCGTDPEELKTEELSCLDIKRILDEAAPFVPIVILTGGEPFLRSDAIEIIEYVKKNKMFCSVLTNGTLLGEKTIEKLIECKVDKINISIDGLKGEHEQLRGVCGIYDTIINNVRLLCKIKREKKSKTPIIQVNYTIFEENYQGMSQFAEFLNNDPLVDIDILSFAHTIYLESEIAELHKEVMKRRFGIGSCVHCKVIPNAPKDSEKIRQEIQRVKSSSTRWKFVVKFLPELNGKELRYYNADYIPGEKRCNRVRSGISILPQGDAAFCADTIIGNLKDHSLKEIWNGDRAEVFRKLLCKELLPYCKRCCWLQR